MKKKAIPAIHVPIQNADGSMQWVWYMFFQWIAENAGAADLSDYFTKEETEELLSVKLDKTTDSNVLYGTDNDGEQYLYSVSYFAVDTAVVHLAREEYISGIKHFTNPRGVDVLAVADAAGHGYRITDLNDTNKSSWFLQYKTVNNDVYTRILNAAYNTYCYIDAVIDENGSRRITFASDYTTMANHPTESSTNSLQVDTVGARVTAINTRANTSLSNLTSVGKNIGNWSSNVTNCITEIPQDINLELSGGTLTLKAGSKVYVPNGSGTFDILTLTVDRTATQSANDSRMYFYNGSYIEKFPVSSCYSGSTAPSGQQYMFWYDTANNVVKKTSDSGSTWESGWSLPFCIATASGGALTSIDQVFNGFGYIGSTIFALPNIKGLAPDGRNADGTLKSVAFTTSSVKTQTLTTNTFNNRNIILRANSFGFSSSASYDEKTNTVSSGTEMIVGKGSASSGKITSLYTKQAFHAVDYDDFISADAQNVKTTGNQHIKDIKTFDSGQINIGNAGYYNNKIEFATSSSATNGGYIDFHYAGSTADYTSRIMETASGQLTLTASNGSLLSVSPAESDISKKIASTEFVNNVKNRNITNCITEIPQDIKLELSSGTLTLKTGSKIHMADGNLNTTTTTTSDITLTTTYNGQYMIALYGGALFIGVLDSCLSGTIANRPSSTAHNAGIYFATDENKIYVTSNFGATWTHTANMSMPFAIITVSGGAISSIDQVFNGFGYIGSTVFALPGVKALQPNGKNTDGTLKNYTVTASSVLTITVGTGTSTDILRLGSNLLQRGNIYYVKDFNYNCTTSVYSANNRRAVANIGTVSYVSGKITSLSLKNIFNALDYNDSNYIANCAMPSDKHVDLTLGANGAIYTAPADGYYTITKQAGASNEYIYLNNYSKGINSGVMATSALNCRCFLPVSKNDSVQINYTLTGTTSMFRFIFANGTK